MLKNNFVFPILTYSEEFIELNDHSIKDFVNNFFFKHNILNEDKSIVIRIRFNNNINLINFFYLNNNREAIIFLTELIQDVISFEKLYYDIESISLDYTFTNKYKVINGLCYFPINKGD